MTRLATSVAALGISAATLLSATGCAVTVSSMPMPKPGIGAPGYTVHASFRDALNLPDRAHVKIGGSDVGVVTNITSTNFIANVEMLIREDIPLPRGTTVELRQATPLGDMFVALALPSEQESGELLRDGDTIGTDHTATGASVEQLMMSISMLINGGGINQAARITSEMNSMFAGRGPQLAHLITEMTSVITALNQRTGDLDGVLGGLDVLTTELASRKAELGQAADTFPELIGLFNENNQRIVDLLTKVSTTMAALEDFSNTSGEDFVSLFDSIQKLMAGFAQADDLTAMLNGLNQLSPRVVASMRGPTLAVSATISYLSLGALTDPTGSRLPELGDLPAFMGSFIQVLEKVFGRLNSPVQPVVPDAPAPAPDAGQDTSEEAPR
ncbi:MCE family protein [Nocardia sp. NPDC055321]